SMRSSFQAPATSELSTLSLHDALPILGEDQPVAQTLVAGLPVLPPHRQGVLGPAHELENTAWPGLFLSPGTQKPRASRARRRSRSEEHTSELQSPYDLVCRLLLEKNNK